MRNINRCETPVSLGARAAPANEGQIGENQFNETRAVSSKTGSGPVCWWLSRGQDTEMFAQCLSEMWLRSSHSQLFDTNTRIKEKEPADFKYITVIVETIKKKLWINKMLKHCWCLLLCIASVARAWSPEAEITIHLGSGSGVGQASLAPGAGNAIL